MKYRCFILIILSCLLIVFGSVGAATTLDPRDYGFREIQTTASINAGFNQLILPANAGFKVGDYVIVEIGKEPGQGKRGTRGVGGVWPAKSYANLAQLQADKSQQAKLFAWTEDTGDVYQWNGPAGANTWVKLWGYGGWYYFIKAIPRSLQARVNAVSTDGRTLTLDRAAAVSVSGANVYFDNAPVLNFLMAYTQRSSPIFPSSDVTVSLPAGSFAVGGVVQLGDKTRWTVAGQGKDRTRFFSPKGVPSVRLSVTFSPQTTLKDFTWEGNFGDNGFGIAWESPGFTFIGAGWWPIFATETELPQGPAAPRGIYFFGSPNSISQDMRVIDVFQQAMATQLSNNTWGYRMESITNSPMREYLQWQFNWTDSIGGGCVDCSVWSSYIIPGFEGFKMNGVSFIRPVGTNAMMSMNTSGNFLIEDAKLTFKAMSRNPALSEYNPIININSNISNQNAGNIPEAALVVLGGTIRNAQIIQEGYIDASGNTLAGIGINDGNPSIRVEGGSYQAPDYKVGSTNRIGAVGLLSNGAQTYVDGYKVFGKASLEGPNFNITVFGAGSVLKNCVAEATWPPNACQKPGTPPAPPPSPDKTRGSKVVDSSGATWTLGEDGRTLRDGVHADSGYGSEYIYLGGVVYVKGTDGRWYKWSNGWSIYSNTDPLAAGTSYKLGDINNDSQITAFDAALAAQAAVGLISLTGDQAKAAEISGDGQVTAFDAALIAQYSVGLITKFPVEG